MKNGLLKRRESFDLFENLDFGIMELGMSDEEPTSNSGPVDPVLMRVGPEDKSGVLGDEQIAKVSPPPVPMTTAATAENAASAASSSVSAFRNGGTLEEGTAARPSFAGGAGNYSAQGGGGSGIQAGVGAGPAGGSGAHGGEQDMDVRWATVLSVFVAFALLLHRVCWVCCGSIWLSIWLSQFVAPSGAMELGRRPPTEKSCRTSACFSFFSAPERNGRSIIFPFIFVPDKFLAEAGGWGGRWLLPGASRKTVIPYGAPLFNGSHLQPY